MKAMCIKACNTEVFSSVKFLCEVDCIVGFDCGFFHAGKIYDVEVEQEFWVNEGKAYETFYLYVFNDNLDAYDRQLGVRFSRTALFNEYFVIIEEK